MRILVIGGTRFIGRSFVEQALERGHEITLFNRGKHDPDAFPGVEQLVGDRDADLEGLKSGMWDAVLDTCGYLPGSVRKTTEFLARRCETYAFISSISVFAEGIPDGVDESGEVATMDPSLVGEFSMENYGALKALCEDVVMTEFPGDGLVIRPGLVIGPGDYSDRFTYWPVRLSQGGKVALPNRPDQPTQFIDARDLAAFTLLAIEQGLTGTYNVTGPESPMSFQEFIATIGSAVGAEYEPVWLSKDVLESSEIVPWSDLPLVLDYDGSSDAMALVSIAKALRDGLRLRSLAETASDTLAWFRATQGGRPLKVGLSPEREQSALRAFELSTPAQPV